MNIKNDSMKSFEGYKTIVEVKGNQSEKTNEIQSEFYSNKNLILAKLGYELDKLVYNKDWRVRQEVAKHGYGLDKLVNDPCPVIREEVANQGYDLNKLINDEDPGVRVAVAKQGYRLDKLINDSCYKVRIEVYNQGYGLDKIVNDKSPLVRAHCAKRGLETDKLAEDEDWEVRYEVAKLGCELDKLVNDESCLIREEVAKHGYGLDTLVNDKAANVRYEVAKQGYGLDKLINDKDFMVRLEVARQGYGLDKLINDECCLVREEVHKKEAQKQMQFNTIQSTNEEEKQSVLDTNSLELSKSILKALNDCSYEESQVCKFVFLGMVDRNFGDNNLFNLNPSNSNNTHFERYNNKLKQILDGVNTKATIQIAKTIGNTANLNLAYSIADKRAELLDIFKKQDKLVKKLNKKLVNLADKLYMFGFGFCQCAYLQRGIDKNEGTVIVNDHSVKISYECGFGGESTIKTSIDFKTPEYELEIKTRSKINIHQCKGFNSFEYKQNIPCMNNLIKKNKTIGEYISNQNKINEVLKKMIEDIETV